MKQVFLLLPLLASTVFAQITSSALQDSTANGNNASTSCGTGITEVSGKIADAANFSGICIISAPSAVFNSTRGTVEEWIFTTGPTGNSPYSFGDSRDSSSIFKFFEMDSTLKVGFVGTSGGGMLVTTSVPASTFSNAWHHVAFTWDSTIPAEYAYVDGVLVGSSTMAFTPPVGSTFSIDGYPNYNSAGSVDEVSYSNVMRSAGWIATEYASYNNPATFYTMSAEMAN